MSWGNEGSQKTDCTLYELLGVNARHDLLIVGIFCFMLMSSSLFDAYQVSKNLPYFFMFHDLQLVSLLPT